jgi:hypothetical protein
MAKVARGKALLAQLRRQAGVRDAEALAAYLGRFKKARKAGRSVAEAQMIARGTSKDRKSTNGSEAARKLSEAQRARLQHDPDDPFAEDYGPPEELTKERKQQKIMEEALLRRMEKEDRSRLYAAIHEVGGIKTRDDLREEYRAIPNNLNRKDGMAGDEIAEYLGTYYQELGIYSENDLLDYFAPDYRRAA